MNTKLLLPLALTLAGATSLMAGTVDVYITGSTAFRANVYNACKNLYSSAPTIYYANAANGGANSGFSSSTASWVMTGSPITAVTNLQGDTLVIHGLFTGSTQGLEAEENSQELIWAAPVGTGGGNATAYVTNSPTVAFSDASGAASPYPAAGNFEEEQVCVQPFIWVKSTASSGAVTNISNVTWEQAEYGITAGAIPLSAWTYNVADTNTLVYLYERTKDSGTRRTFTAGEYYQYNDPVNVYIYDFTNNFWYTPTVTANVFAGFSPNGVVGTEGPGNNNANLNWGFGYIGGGDIKTSLNNNNVTNQGIAYMSISDGKGVGASNWANVVSYNGIWPTRAAAGIHGNTGTNDYSPITDGYYPNWGYEVLVLPINPGLITDQDITQTELGDEFTPGTFMGVFNAQTLFNGGSPLTGSIEADIVASQPSGATAIPLAAMLSNRSAVGGVISPF